MAAAAAAKDSLEDTRVPLFTKEEYDGWMNQVEAECDLRKEAGRVRSGAFPDPATRFRNLYPDEFALISIAATPTDEDAVESFSIHDHDLGQIMGSFVYVYLLVRFLF